MYDFGPGKSWQVSIQPLFGPFILHNLIPSISVNPFINEKIAVVQVLISCLILLVLGFLVHSSIGGGNIVPTDFENTVKAQVFIQIR